jgi:DNA-directed RNA polymerase I, II, and III subunit RPABC2
MSSAAAETAASSQSMLVKDQDDLMSSYDPSENKTSPIVTRYERAKLLGVRTQQIARGGKSLVDDSDMSMEDMSPADLAVEELRHKRTPYIIVRTLPDGSREYWKVKDMIVIM